MDNKTPRKSPESLSKEEPDDELNVSREKNPKLRDKERRNKFIIEFVRRRIYESREKLRLRRKLMRERNKIRRIKKAEKQRRNISRKIIKQARITEETE